MLKNELNCCYKCRKIKFSRFFTTNHVNSEILSDLFGLSSLESKLFIEKNKLQNREAQLLMNCTKYCRKLGYTDNEILATPTLLRLHPLELEQHHLSLEEGGFQSIGPKILARARNYMRKVISILKSKNIIHEKTNVPQHFLNYIEDVNIANKISVIRFSDANVWNEVHKSILQSFLRMRLNATEDEIIRLFRIHKTIKNKSFRVVQENIAIAEDLGFDQRKLIKHGYLLHNYPKYPKTVLKDFPNLAGSDMRKAMWMYPKLVMASPTNIIKIYGTLKEFDIEDAVIRKQMNVFHLSPTTVKLRLEEIEQSPDFRVLLKHPKLLSLIVHHNRAKSRLSFLQQLQLRCASFTVLGYDDDEIFNDYIREGKDINKFLDVLIFLKKLFNVNEEYIKKKLKIHPFYLQVPLKDMQNTYDFLISQHFRCSDILKVMQIILYPQEKIEKKLNEMQSNKEINFESVTPAKKLNLLLYFIERDHHFTGNGIWMKYNEVTDMSEKSNQ
ncbi:transcription termination factor 5, mitochondrial [Anoplophora glabripennis]|uniref:transcription termination factor 5, mitochondrial n=1 Tax=Anoplophora glabripennis TaxID=217634 RepID=UPI000873CDB5|nr:transcription termination factor 5, mitochondrial [Anoplophora glabripennis]